MFNYFPTDNFPCISAFCERSYKTANNEETRQLKRASDHIINISSAL
ncbi:hypothetical protein UUU_42920 [Klebsiella pneumoniae subsp. pneumoniae DSM 30104 = JCM 1662 = NBRC 14940]|nr:hypothetical protein UUU_42920 [Klebsiella pneumoniae subsp. pneumoniae DSM 30104 = JCM 1662 = NBRC 14940]